jgi:ATP-binding cassette subfamily B (MDR/TAP) protein 9
MQTKVGATCVRIITCSKISEFFSSRKQLADGNSVSEATISSMPTVRAFDAATTEFKEFEKCMEEYLSLNMKAAVAYSGYATVSTSLPQLVTALVVFYGGLMVRNGDLSSGELVSFLLYLQSLSDAFSSIGYIFSSLTQAVGAADKGMYLVFLHLLLST